MFEYSYRDFRDMIVRENPDMPALEQERLVNIAYHQQRLEDYRGGLIVCCLLVLVLFLFVGLPILLWD